MSYLGQKILYGLLNRDKDVLAERVFAPWPDLERELRAAGIPLASLENGIPLRDFDIVGFSLLYELNFSNVLTILDLGGIALTSAERGEEAPLVVAGGPAAFNPEPVADLFDLVFLGDGEEGFPEIVRVAADLRRRGLRAPGPAARAGQDRRASTSRRSTRPRSATARPWPCPRPARRAPRRPCASALAEDFPRSFFPERIVVPEPARRVRPGGRRGSPGLSPELPFLPGREPLLPAPAEGRRRSSTGTAIRSLRQTGYEDASLYGPVGRRPPSARGDRPPPHGRARPGEDLALPLVAPAGAAVAGARREHPQGPQDRFHPRARGGDRAAPGRRSTRSSTTARSGTR
ncbi:MAG: hypothetical protein M0C28_04295 [Candidatus Moduliflexus flocculans]|nr:hypothetical protein [Candidatus Moduliflexus flocculans]